MLKKKKLFDPKKFGQQLRQHMIENDLTVRSAASIIGCSQATISRVCRGFPPDVENYLMIQHWMDKQKPNQEAS
jgi:hypothetical protein